MTSKTPAPTPRRSVKLRRRLAQSLTLSLGLATVRLSPLGSESAQAANTADNWTGAATSSVATPGNWSLGTVPTSANDAVFTTSSNGTGIRTLSSQNAAFGTLDVTATTGTFSIRNATVGATNSNLTIGGGSSTGNSVSGTAADLLYAATGSTLQLLGDNPNGTGTLNVILGQSGNFDAAGTISVSSAISDGGSNFALTKTGAGALTLSGANTFGGGVTLSTGTLNINNAAALGTGAFTISGGVIDNTSGADITTSTNNNAQAWNGDFTPAPRV